MKLVFHLGLHRAASTSLQAWIEANRRQLEQSRRFIYSDLSSGEQGSVFGVLMGRTLVTLGSENVAAMISEELARREADFAGGLLSDENLLGMLPGLPQPAFAAAGRLSDVLQRLSADHDIVPVIVLREHVPWLVSLYRIAQFRGDTRSFSEFASQALPGDGGFAALLTRLGDAVGPGKLAVTTLDAIAADGGKAFLGGLAGALGVTSAIDLSLPRKNRSPSLLACALRQEVARRGAMLVIEDSVAVQQLIRRLSDSPGERDELNRGVLADVIRRRSVPVAESQRFQARLRNSQMQFEREPGSVAFLSAGEAKEVLHAALLSVTAPVLPAAALAALRQRFAQDRQWVAERYAPRWQTHSKELQ